MDISDEALVEKYRQTKDFKYFGALTRRYQNRLFNATHRIMGNQEEAEEVVQDTLLKTHANLNQFKRQSSFASWIFAIANNICVDRLRIRKRRSVMQVFSFNSKPLYDLEDDATHFDGIGQIADDSLNPLQELDVEEEGKMVLKALADLPEVQRTVLVLHDIEGFVYQDIAQITGSSIGTVRSRLHYGRLKLRELLNPYFSSNSAIKTGSKSGDRHVTQ
ncbi:sigma-70 family RNA polymerase sigma factor [bacterium]|nr:sigma-70 family RNA polymerase sigma factor [bacterium]QQR56489.1 MAG: sigma-70 family RNA polymerase sigma factor [Candidatus Melainabacteria bacterium]